MGLPYYHFDSVIHAADSRWERQNQSLLSEYEAQTARTAAVLLGGALRAVCLQFATCTTQAEAARLIDEALSLLSGLLGRLGPASPPRRARAATAGALP